jgi:hypothetical protein
MNAKKLHAHDAGDAYALATGRPMPISTQHAARSSFFTGNEHGQVWGEYLSDDEYLGDAEPALDAHAYDEWIVDLTDAGLIGDC